MAPFNRRQIGYIQAIAGRQQHRTLIAGQKNETLSSGLGTASPGDLEAPKTLNSSLIYGYYGSADQDDLDAKSLLMHTYFLDGNGQLAFDSRSAHNNDKLEAEDYTGLFHSDHGQGKTTMLAVFEAPVKGFADVSPHTHVPAADFGSSGVMSTVDTLSAANASGELVRNSEHISSIHRATPDGFLNSTDVKFRFTLPTKLSETPQSGTSPMGQDHYEFRWIVWRSKKPSIGPFGDTSDHKSTNLEAIRDGASFRNPAYDFWMGQTGRKRGMLGYTLNRDLDKEKVKDAPDAEVYCGYRRESGALVNTGNLLDIEFDGVSPKDGIPNTEAKLTVDDLMTMRINKDDYVVMKDIRFFLGKEHGKSHFEDTLHWDWNDPIDTPMDNVLSSPTLNGKNYRWHMTLLGTAGGPNICEVNSSVRWTTKMESG